MAPYPAQDHDGDRHREGHNPASSDRSPRRAGRDRPRRLPCSSHQRLSNTAGARDRSPGARRRSRPEIRVIAERLESIWGQTVLIENKPGGGLVMATQTRARSAPDGYTIGLLGSSLSINAVLRKNLPYDS